MWRKLSTNNSLPQSPYVQYGVSVLVSVHILFFVCVCTYGTVLGTCDSKHDFDMLANLVLCVFLYVYGIQVG